MENPNLNQTMMEKVQVVKDRLYALRNIFENRWIATDSYAFQRVEESLDSISGMFNQELEDFIKAEEAYKAAVESYNEGVVEIKEVRHPRTGEMVKLRVRKSQVRGLSQTNDELLAAHIEAVTGKKALFVNGRVYQCPFISDCVEPADLQIQNA